MPVNYWRLPNGEWMPAIVVGRRGLFGARRAAREQRALYAARGCTGWVRVCPRCGHVYGEGGS